MSGDGFLPTDPGAGARAAPAAAVRPGFAALHSTRWLQFLVLAGPALAVLLAIYLYPLGKLLALSFGGVEPSAAAYRKFFESPLYLAILARTFRISFVVTSICLVAGYPVGYLLSRVGPGTAQVLMAACSAGLAINADLDPLTPALWPLFVLPALSAGFSGLDSAGRNAIVPNLVRRSEVSTANAIFQALFQFGLVAGPALAGLLLAGAGVRFVYWLDVAGFGVALLAVFLISPQPVREPGHRPGLRSVMEGLRYVRGKQAIEGAYLIDINAMVFGMPRALFPALAVMRFGGGAATLGFLYAAPGAGALLGALTTGWVSRIQRQGLAVIVAVIGWGAATTCFGLVSWLPLALVLLAAAGFDDVISAVFRSTIIQLAVPDALRGRLAGLQIAVVTGGPRVGDLEAGAVATAFGNTVSVVSGGLACIAGALLLARALPGFRRQRMDPAQHQAAG